MADLKYHPLTKSQHLDPLLNAIGDKRIVLLGEASHGTSEYYTWRTAISKRLIEEKGFTFIAVEGDWPDCYQVNRYIKSYPDAASDINTLLHQFNRWPTWMWGNWEIAALTKYLREHNDGKNKEQMVGLFGLDVYSLHESLEEILHFLEKNDGSTVAAAKKAFNCFQPYQNDPQQYAVSVAMTPEHCEEEVIALLQQISAKLGQFPNDPEGAFSTEQNALVAVNAERYYRAMIQGGGASWNVRDRHMMETLNRLLEFHGPDAKAIVWEHNTHIGDARFTDMARSKMVNIGQLAREEHGRENCFLVGFGSYEGTVIAGEEWGAPMQKMNLPKAAIGSWEEQLHDTGVGNMLLFSEDLKELKTLKDPIGHRAVGVVYDPLMERFGNYVPSVIPERYDAFLFFDKTNALHPVKMPASGHKEPDLYPWNY